MNSELRRPAVNSVKRGNFVVGIRTRDKVDSAGRVTLLPGTTFLHIRRGNNLSKCFKSVFYVFFKNWPVNMNATLTARVGCYFELCNMMW